MSKEEGLDLLKCRRMAELIMCLQTRRDEKGRKTGDHCSIVVVNPLMNTLFVDN